MTSVFFGEEIMDFINGTTGIQPPTNSSTTSTPFATLPASTDATLPATASSSTVEPPTDSYTLSSTPFANLPVSTAAILPSTCSSTASKISHSSSSSEPFSFISN